jgi:hypothetical protein
VLDRFLADGNVEALVDLTLDVKAGEIFGEQL